MGWDGEVHKQWTGIHMLGWLKSCIHKGTTVV